MDALLISFRKWLATSSRKQKYTAALLTFSLMSTIGLLLFNRSSGAMADPLQASPFYFVGVFAKLGVVLLLILASSAVFRRWSVPGSAGGKMRHMQVMETIRLSPKQALHLVTIGDRQLLIGATDQNVSLLTAVELDLMAGNVDAEPTFAKTDFASLLQALNFRSTVDATGKN